MLSQTDINDILNSYQQELTDYLMQADIETLARYRCLIENKTDEYSQTDIFNALFEYNNVETSKLYVVLNAYGNSISNYYMKTYNGEEIDNSIDLTQEVSNNILRIVITSINKRLN